MSAYIPSKSEKKWQKYWRSKKLHLTKDADQGRDNFMLLTEFPYTSGDLHIGHWYTFAVSDIKARHLRMTGYNVLYPVGFDAFGLPAENAAIKHSSTPGAWTKRNIARMTKQLESTGASFDWGRAVNTSDPEYYRWTQWIFNQLLKRGLVYRAKTLVNWCPKDKTVLANEQVVNGCCERCDTPVIQRELEQWMMRITQYADRLTDDIEGLDWPHTTRAAQQNWIGRSSGARIIWKLKVPGQTDRHTLETFTTRPDTLYGATFVVISPEIAKTWMTAGWAAPKEVKNYISQALSKRELERLEGAKEKTGVFTGVHAVNPLTQELVPVWVADYVLGSYGTGAIMAVPAHDERDFDFAMQFNLPIKQVIKPETGNWKLEAAHTGAGILVNSGPYSGKTSEEASAAIISKLKELGEGGPQTTYKLRDWVLSRQRYWGVPIPIIRCTTCGHVPVSDKDLPVKLPPLKDFKPADDGRSPLAKAASWLKVRCPKCNEWAERETDTMDTFVDSSWYYIRYADPKNKKKLADPAKIRAWLPVPLYIGGPEHNTMHLLYARFIAKALHDAGIVPFSEPFTARRNHSVILGPDGNRMSKSRGNVVDPDQEVARYGADAVRMYLAFMGPYSDQTMPWDPRGITGIQRFIRRVWELFAAPADDQENDDIERQLHAATRSVGADVADLHYNTAVSGMMKLLNAIEDAGAHLTTQQRERFCLLLAPLAPHLAEELWQTVLGKKRSVHLQSWPEYDGALLRTDTVQLPVQVNGKVRGIVTVAPTALQDDVVFLAQGTESIARHTQGRQVLKIIYLPGKMLNIVVESQS